MARELYDRIGKSYAKYRKPDPRIASAIVRALGDARAVINIGAGTGSYEPFDRELIAVEPSETMIRQRTSQAAPVVRASALNLPFRDGEFDGALAILTIHHWPDQARGLREMVRVARRRIVLTWDPAHSGMWLTRDYFSSIAENSTMICRPIETYSEIFQNVKIISVPIPCDCSDGFLHAYWQRPHAYLDAGVRSGISAFSGLTDLESGLALLARDLEDGTWQARNGYLRRLSELDLGYRLVVSA